MYERVGAFPGTHQLFWNRLNAPAHAFPNAPTFGKLAARAFPPEFPKVSAFPSARARAFQSKLNAQTFLGEPPVVSKFVKPGSSQ